MSARNGKTLPATEVKNRFGKVLNEIRRTGGPIIVERAGKPVAVILSIDSFERLHPGPRPKQDRRAMALSAFGMWAARPDVTDDWIARGRSRWQSRWKNG